MGEATVPEATSERKDFSSEVEVEWKVAEIG